MRPCQASCAVSISNELSLKENVLNGVFQKDLYLDMANSIPGFLCDLSFSSCSACQVSCLCAVMSRDVT